MDEQPREKIAKTIWLDGDECIAGTVTDVCWREMPPSIKRKWLIRADRIIALFGEKASCVGLELCCDLEAKVKEAMKQERERIHNSMVNTLPTGELTGWDFIQWFQKFWKGKD